VNVESPHGLAGPTLTTISVCVDNAEALLAESSLRRCCAVNAGSLLSGDDGVTIQLVYAVAASHKACFTAAEMRVPSAHYS
jgi:hypothetical protein